MKDILTCFPAENFDLIWDFSHPNWYEHQDSLPKHLDLFSVEILLIGLRILLLGRKMSSKFSIRPSLDRTIVSNAKFEVNKFDGINNFGIWQYKLWISSSNKSWILL